MVYAVINAVVWGLFPVLVNRGVQIIPPLTFAAVSTLLAFVAAFFYTWAIGKLPELKNTKAYKSLVIISFTIVIIPYALFFIGAKYTSGVNTSMLLLAEIIFTLFLTHYIGEKTTAFKLLGAGGVFIGSLFILYNGKLSINFGDLLIILSTLTYPVGNFYAKKALNMVSGATILLVRSMVGGFFLLILAMFVERQSNIPEILMDNWPLLLFNGLVLLGLSKIIWYECLKRVDITKAISITMSYPLFSLLFLVWLFDEKISLYQLTGIAVIMLGVYFSIKRRSVDPNLTKYSANVI